MAPSGFWRLGEIPIWGMHGGSVNAIKPFDGSREAKKALRDFATWAAENSNPLHIQP